MSVITYVDELGTTPLQVNVCEQLLALLCCSCGDGSPIHTCNHHAPPSTVR